MMRRVTVTNRLLLLWLVAASAAAFAPSRPAFSASSQSSLRTTVFDEEAFESDRLAKDAEAMNAMKDKAEEEFSNLRTPWKWVIRKRIWDLMEAKDIARFPRPVHHRIPNFDGAEIAQSA